MRLGSLEAGGTKMVCAVGNEQGEIFEQISIPTQTPEITMPKIIEYFKEKQIEALGVACFGPIELDKNSPKYGFITSTPKVAWRDTPIVQILQEGLGCPVGFDTDVNGSVLGEATFGQAKGKKNIIYITIGTGIGAGIIVEGNLVHGMLHPEAGHVLMRPHQNDSFKGHCVYHQCCFEGMAAGPAIEARWGKKAVELADQLEVWDLEAYYIAQALCGYILTLSPEMIILGGGVMHQEQLFPMIREKVLEMLADYIQTEELADMDHYIVPASLHDDQGIMGCLELARRECGYGM